jgi:hypothetical protein
VEVQNAEKDDLRGIGVSIWRCFDQDRVTGKCTFMILVFILGFGTYKNHPPEGVLHVNSVIQRQTSTI